MILSGTEVGANSIINVCSAIKGRNAENTIVAENPERVIILEKITLEELSNMKIWTKGLM